ncbi:MAG: phage integrase N-terminal SAM-like domain-containing protein [Halothiobacillus sp.]
MMLNDSMPAPDRFVGDKPPKLLDQVRNKIRLKHYSIRTEQAYTDWIKRFILFHGKGASDQRRRSPSKDRPMRVAAQKAQHFVIGLGVVE